MMWLSGVAASHLENSLSAASIIASLIGRRRQAVAQFLTARQRDFYQEPAGGAVAKRRIIEDGVISGLQRALGPARARQNPGTRHFENPWTGSLAILGVRLDHEGDVRIGPVDGLDRAFHGFGMVEIVGCIRMVRSRHAGEAQHQGRSKESSCGRHLDHPYFTARTEPSGFCVLGTNISLPN